MTHSKDALKTRTGQLLYRHLPEEYRYRDTGTAAELGDLEAYLHGFGDLLDLFRATLDQAYADGFAEPTDTGAASQVWLLPYLADLLGTHLLSPDLDGTGAIRRAELKNTVDWSKGKGTLGVTDDVADVMADAETVVVEGWKRVALTPRLGLPPFSLTPQAGRDLLAMAPQGTPDPRFTSRAVRTDTDTGDLQSFRLLSRDVNGHAIDENINWVLRNPGGVPCFPGAYDDRSVTTPDIRRTGRTPPGAMPRRVRVYVQPQSGFFEPGLKQVAPSSQTVKSWVQAQMDLGIDPVVIGPREVYHILNLNPDDAPDRLTISGGRSLQSGMNVHLHDLNFLDTIRVRTGAELSLRDCAVERVLVEQSTAPDAVALTARNCLFNRLSGPAGFAKLEYVTVMESTLLGRIWASDCLFVGKLDDPTCFDDGSCVRFSRVQPQLDPEHCLFARALSNTVRPARFVRRPFGTPGSCAVREAKFGEPGCGVLDHSADVEIRKGSEDGMEMGTYHDRGYAARLIALERKLTDQLPLGQELQLTHDPMLALAPPTPK
ncbi:hypothetical protein [Palleronia caenipelagi]|uniref:Phage tail protein n=1 Tax=Palleronia caenipelagi TaxID=2489174 RepID=A0A547PPY2_9RHOB|nr:hypothetical protein [Palleronia caenipelagi]TRD16104.1 hypothetical protein FEV53_14565 [Palleronia caenipelagi]